MTNLRMGHGYDVHRLTAGRPLILGGVHVPYDRGLDGHSDADVLTHAVMDALLGAAALGDIGRLFPDSDDAFLNISSLVLLSRVRDALADAGYRAVNIDATLIAQAPKVGPYRRQMQENLAAARGKALAHLRLRHFNRHHPQLHGACRDAGRHGSWTDCHHPRPPEKPEAGRLGLRAADCCDRPADSDCRHDRRPQDRQARPLSNR